MVIKREKLLEQAKEVLKKLEGLNIEIKAKMTETDKLYGAIKAADIIAKITDKAKVNLDKKNLPEFKPIKKLGTYKVKIVINEEASTDVTVNVVKE
jgi:large subunit ribosomal protein L9